MALTWANAVEIIRPYVVRILTPTGSGTGFVLARGTTADFCVVATAAHVIEHAHSWLEPVRLDHTASSQHQLLKSGDRAIFMDEKRDTAALLFKPDKNLDVPQPALPMAPKDHHLRVGFEVGWIGFPAVSPTNLCFFGGRVSAFLESDSAYLIDGVSIHGVSGGPAFEVTADANAPTIIGVVSAYIPNLSTGQPLPGLAVVRDVTQFHELADLFSSLDQAQEKQSPPAPTPPPAEPSRQESASAEPTGAGR